MQQRQTADGEPAVGMDQHSTGPAGAPGGQHAKPGVEVSHVS